MIAGSGGALTVLGLLIFAALAAAVLYQLYAVLGRRVGRQPDETIRNAPALVPGALEAPRRGTDDTLGIEGLAAMRVNDPAFNPDKFLEGARQAYQRIVQAFSSGDRDALSRLVSPLVLDRFGQVIDKRQSEGRSETVEFTTPPRADIETLAVEGGLARAKVRFLAEFRSRSKGPEGEAVDDRRTAELWTFERKVADRDPNWVLVRVDAAEA
jgi:predicted lipid-binding transport protein (Tim44 family)